MKTSFFALALTVPDKVCSAAHEWKKTLWCFVIFRVSSWIDWSGRGLDPRNHTKPHERTIWIANGETLLQVVETVMPAYFSVRLRPKVKSTTPMALAITTTTMILAANIPGLSTFVIGIIV